MKSPRVRQAVLLAVCAIAFFADAPLAAAGRPQTVRLATPGVTPRVLLTLRLPSGLMLDRHFSDSSPGLRATRAACPHNVPIVALGATELTLSLCQGSSPAVAFASEGCGAEERLLAYGVTRRGTNWGKLDDGTPDGEYVLTSRRARVPGGYLAADFFGNFTHRAIVALLRGATVRLAH